MNNAKMQIQEERLTKFICHIILKLTRISIFRERSKMNPDKKLDKKINKKSDELIKYYSNNLINHSGPYLQLSTEFKKLVFYIIKKIRKGQVNTKYSKKVEDSLIEIDLNSYSRCFSKLIKLIVKIIIETEENSHFSNIETIKQVESISPGHLHQYEINGLKKELKKLDDEKGIILLN